jgi:hypothetical protein
MRLNPEVIKKELERIDQNESWLAGKMGMSRQALNFHLKYGGRTLTTLEKFSRVLRIDVRELIK